MSNSNKTGFMDRRVPTKAKEPVNMLTNTYNRCGFAKRNTPEIARIEKQSFHDAMEKLDDDEKTEIKLYLNQLLSGHNTKSGEKIRKFGRDSAIELLGKLGIFLASNGF